MLRTGTALALVLALPACSDAVCPVRAWDDPARALSAYDSMRAPARVVRAEASVDRRQGDQRVRGTILMLLARPDRVRFDAMTQFGPAAILTSDGQTFALTDLREERFVVGPTCPANIERLVGLPLEAREVAQLLLGEGPRIPAEDEEIRCAEGRYRVTRRGEGRVQHLELEVRQADVREPPELQRLRLRRAEVLAADGSLEWRATWDEYRFVEDPRSDEVPRRGIAMPFRIRFEHPGQGTDTLIRFASIDLNAEVPSDAFVQEPRPGLTVEATSCE